MGQQDDILPLARAGRQRTIDQDAGLIVGGRHDDRARHD
jgi:hypothetical protein